MLTIRESARDDEGIWLAISAGNEETVRVLISPLAEAAPRSKVSLWWSGSATVRTIQDWAEDALRSLDPKIEPACSVEVWADDAPEERQSYDVKNVGRIADDIRRWAADGAVACSIVRGAPQHHHLVYMWAELKASEADTHGGEVGLEYAVTDLQAPYGKQVLSKLLADTAVRHFSRDEIVTLCDALAVRVGTAASDFQTKS